MGDKLVSIIIPSCNDSRFLKDSIGSALSQTYSNIDIIVVNDGSSNQEDKEFFENFPYKNVKLINKENEGLSRARNTGIAESKGEFFVPLDSDDKLDKDFVTKTMSQMSDDVSVVYTDQKWFGDEESIQKVMDFDFKFLLVKNHISVCSLIRKSAFEEIKKINKVGYNPNMTYGYEDWDLWISLGENGFKFKCIHEPLFFYRRRGDSMSSNTIRKHDYLVEQLYKNHEETYKKNHEYVILTLQKLYKEREIYAHSLDKKIENKTWLLKRILKNITQA